ncbi:MAG: hypothetical protein IJZ16_07210, partial [Clostridia bacterium]|nr:hypothetical protein [Clostridia bacterium]
MFESTIICGQIYLGKQGEHHARRFSFNDFVIWKETFGEGRCELFHQRNGDEAPYPVVLTVEDGVPYWCVTNADTSIAGEGKCEVRYIVDDVLVKSNIYTTIVQEALGEGAEEPPEPAKAWVEQVLEAAEKTQEGTKDFTKEYAYSKEETDKKLEEYPTKEEASKEYVNKDTFEKEINTAKKEARNIFSGALKGSASGVNAVSITDISPVEHDINVSTNNISLPNDGLLDYSGDVSIPDDEVLHRKMSITLPAGT